MSAEANLDAAAPNLNLTPEEKRAYGQLFRQADTDNVGVVTGEVAVKFFEKTKLDSRVLGEIWQIADKENRGFLTPAGFGIVLRLIGHAQAAREPSPELAYQPGPLPRFEGVILNLGVPAPPAPAPLQAQSTGPGPIRIPPLTPEKVAQYSSLFERQPLQSGNMLPGDQAKNIFEKSGLPNEVLGRIWQLADTEQRGALVLTEFVIAMHLLTSMKSGTLRSLPNILPAALYEAATRRTGSAPRQSPQSTGPPPMSSIQRQLSGSAPLRQNSPLGRPPLGVQATGIPPQPTALSPQNVGVAPQTTGGDWLIAPADKVRFDQFFADLDKANRGFITGEEAVPFLSQSSLPEDILAQIWDLADINSEGRLTRDTFAVAMYLIRQQRSRQNVPLPTALPPNLIPPSLRGRVQASVPGPSPFDAPTPAPPQPPQPKSALDDLFGLDASSPPAPAQAPLSTGGSAARDPFAGAGPGSPVQLSPKTSTFKPFIPSSTFGKSLTSHDTGGSGGSAPKASAMDDLLGDNDPEASKRITNESTELANLSNQVSSLSKQMQQVQGQRTSTQKEINQASEQKKNFEQRLAQLRSLYEKEAQEVRALEEQLKTVREETRKLTGEMVTIDGNYKDLSSQHHQLSEALRTDQQENANLKQRIAAVNAEIAQLKPQIEKLKSEARQQKGLVAIHKKQLSTSESDRDKLKGEIEDLTKSNEELSRQASTGSPVAGSALLASPALSTASANNPFFRRTGSADIMGAFASPPAKPYGEKSFDDIFGKYIPSSSATPPPITSFNPQNTGNSSASFGSYGTPSGPTPIASRQATMAADPPAPPESQQLNSSFLPFGDPPQSLSSSRQVSPPVSRAGDSAVTAQAPPTPLEPAATGQSATSTSDANKKSPPTETEEKPPVTSNGSIPGAFPDEPTTDTKPPSYPGKRDSDPFGGLKDSGNAKVDFDSAFASFSGSTNRSQDQSKKDPGNAFTSFNSEFPPISELERDDDSETASEGHRFDDDFAPASPPENRVESKEAPKAPSSPTTSKSTAVSEAPTAEDATRSPAQSKYGYLFPDAFTPATSRQSTNIGISDLSAFPEPPKTSPGFPPKEDDPFAHTPSTSNTATTAKKGAFDDMSDDFDGLEDAKEGSADDEFANISRSNLDDFNPVFDSSPPPSQPKSESTGVSNAFGNDSSSYDFRALSTASTGTTAGGGGAPLTASTSNTGQSSSKGPTAPENQDWDAIFASLDSPSEAANPSKNGDEPSSAVQRPSTGRALTEEGTHDDPFVKDLVNMGYARVDSIRALEKFDYNIDRAANFLANQS